MTQMSMNKVIHGAVRRDLDRFLGALERFPAGDGARAKQLGLAWRNFDEQLTRHHEGEHEIAWPALEQVGVTRATLEVMDSEHEAMATELASTRIAFGALESSPGAGEAEAALAAVRRLRDVTVAHLDHEEREIEPTYLAHADDPPIKEMGRKFSRAQGPRHAGSFFAWVLDGATPAEREAITHEVPGPVLSILSGVFGRGYRKQVAPVWRG